MVELKHPRQIRLIEPFIFFILAIAAIIYAIAAFNTSDFLWFAGGNVDATPDRIIIWQEGERLLIQPGHPDYAPLAQAAHESLHAFSNNNLINIGFGEDTLDYYTDAGVMVEFYYDQPLNYRASFRVGEPTQLLVPVDGRHAGNNYFFRGDRGEWWFGAMRMADPAPLFNALSALGYAPDGT